MFLYRFFTYRHLYIDKQQSGQQYAQAIVVLTI